MERMACLRDSSIVDRVTQLRLPNPSNGSSGRISEPAFARLKTPGKFFGQKCWSRQFRSTMFQH